MIRVSCASIMATAVVLVGQGSVVMAQVTVTDDERSRIFLEEVIVTAQRREQSIQDVGVVVNQFSREDLQEMAVVDTTDLAQLVPGLYVAGAYGGQSQQFTMRGVTQSDYVDYIENPVAFYIDDVYIPASQGQTMGFFDISRAEVLKGPQGTLFGRNATGGLVHTVVAKPELDEVGGYLNFSYGKYDEINAQGAINFGIGDTVAIRVSGLHSEIDDYWDNLYPAGGPGNDPILSFDGPGGNSEGAIVTPNGEDLGGSETNAGRLQVLFEPNDALRIRLTGSFADTDMSISPYSQEVTIAEVDEEGRVIQEFRVDPTETRVAIGPGGSNAFLFVPGINGIIERPVPGGNFFGAVPLDPDDLELSEEFALSDLNRVESQIYAAHIEYNFGDVVLNSVTSSQNYEKEVYLGHGSPAATQGFAAWSDTDAWSQELRLSGETAKVRWQTGIFYLNNEVDVLQGILRYTGSALANIGTIFTGDPTIVEDGDDLVTDLAFSTESYSVFGQIEYDINDEWVWIAGLRYINEDQTYRYRHFSAANLDDYQIENDIVLAPAFQPDFNDSRNEDLWTGKLQLEYRPNDAWLLFAGINRGVKGGNYNAPFTFGPGDALPESAMSYDPEELLSYEGGFKLTGDRWLLNSSAFFYDYQDFQAFVFTTASGIVRNVDAEVYGVDIDAGIQLTESLRLGAGYSFSHAEIDDFEIAPGVFRTVRSPYSPRTQAGANLNYEGPQNVANGKLSLNATVNYAGKIFHNIRNFDAQEFDSRTLVNLTATWKSNQSGLSLSIYGRNVTDERYGQIAFDNTVIFGGQNVSYGKPRAYGITVGFEF